MRTDPLTTLKREIVADISRVAALLGVTPGYSLTCAAYARAGGRFANDVIRAAGGWLALTADAGYPSRKGGALRPRHQWKKTRLRISQRELDAALDAVVGHTPAPRGLPRIMGHKHIKPPGIDNSTAHEEAGEGAVIPTPFSAEAQAAADAVLVRRLDAAMAFIHAHFRDGIGLPEIAKAADYSPFHLHRRFQRHFGRTPKQVIAELQVEEAKRLMAAGTPLSEVAPLAGFAHQSHFTSRFKQLTLTTPSRWVRGHRDRPALPPMESMPEAA